MEVLRGTLDVNEEVAVAPETVGDARLVLAEPVVVRNANKVDL